MNEKTKITLSAKELDLVCNTDIILTKLTVIEKVYQLLGEISLQWQQKLAEFDNNLNPALKVNPPKIAKGENYKGLPYVILDYPRCFGKDNTAAIRLLFWWGNFFSINLHLSGSYQQAALPKLLQKFEWLQQNSYWICINITAWEHHFLADNFILLTTITKEQFAAKLTSDPFIKIAKKIPLNEWDSATEFMVQSFENLIKCSFTKHPADETNLSPGIPITGFDL